MPIALSNVQLVAHLSSGFPLRDYGGVERLYNLTAYHIEDRPGLIALSMLK